MPPTNHYWVHARHRGPEGRGYWAFLVQAPSFDGAAEALRREAGESWEVRMIALATSGRKYVIRATTDELAARGTGDVLFGREIHQPAKKAAPALGGAA